MRKTKLIVDSGSSKTDWVIIRSKRSIGLGVLKGMNPYFLSYEEIREEFETGLVPSIMETGVDTVYFYGAGCVFDKAEVVRKVITDCVPTLEVHVYSDLLGAAHSTCGYEAGIVCIMGTGSNSCFYDGKQIVKNVPSLGYILGDEGGGVTLGRRVVSDILKGLAPKDLQDKFYECYRLTQAILLDKIYKQPNPNRFLASFSPFLHCHIDFPYVRQLVSDCFLSFFTRNVMQYDYQSYQTHFVGSIACHYRDILTEVAEKQGICVGKIINRPINELVEYYQKAKK